MAIPNTKPSEADRQRQPFDTIDAFAERALAMVKDARAQIRIFSNHLEAYTTDAFYSSLSHMLIQHPSRQARLLVRDTGRLVQNDNRLIELSQRLSSRLQIRKLDPEYPVTHSEFMLVDNHGILYCQEPDQYLGYSINYAPAAIAELCREFDRLWNNSLRDSGLLRLHI